jgi:hypothetical protein
MGISESVVIAQPASTAGDQAHIDAMIAKADGQIAPEAPPVAPADVPADVPADAPAERPSWLPEKFKTAEDFAKAYGELEAKQSGKVAETPPVAPELNADGTPVVPAVDPAADALKAKGLDLAEFSTEFSTSGALAPESYAKLEAAGYPKAVVDQYIAGQQALAVSYEADIKSAAGGAEQFAEVADWAAANLTNPEKVAYNAAIDSGNVEQAKLAVAGLTAKYTAANPSEGTLLGGRTSNVAGDAYGSTAEMTADMRDPRYQVDSAFRQKVMDKISRSSIL